jgi:hypothetical protein
MSDLLIAQQGISNSWPSYHKMNALCLQVEIVAHMKKMLAFGRKRES